jgi:hypothetical protein
MPSALANVLDETSESSPLVHFPELSRSSSSEYASIARAKAPCVFDRRPDVAFVEIVDR